MTTGKLYRIAGLGLILGGTIAAIGDVGQNLVNKNPPGSDAAIAALASFVGSIVVVICLPAVAARQARTAGVLGLIGYAALAVTFLIFGVASSLLDAFVRPNLPADLAATPPTGLVVTWILAELTGLIGLVLLGIATLRARVFPAWTGWAFLASAILLVIGHAPPPFGHIADIVHTVPLYVALIAMAYTLVRSSPAEPVPAEHPTLASLVQ